MLKIIGLVVISLLFIITLPAAVLGLSIQTLFYPDVYQSALEENNAYNVITDQIEIRGQSIPVEMIKPISNKLIVNTLAYLRSDVQKLDLKIEVNPDDIRTAFEKNIEEIRVCDDGESFYVNGEINCRPSNIPDTEILDNVLEQQGIDINDYTSIDIAEIYNPDETLTESREMISMFRMGVNISFILALIMISLIVLLTRSTISSMTKWLGANFLLIGILLSAAGFFLVNMASAQITNSIPQQMAFLGNFAIDIMSSVLNTVMIYGIVILLAGIALFAYSYMYKEKVKK